MYLGTKSDELYGRLFSKTLIKGSFLSILEKSVYMMDFLLLFFKFCIVNAFLFLNLSCKNTKNVQNIRKKLSFLTFF